MSVNENILVVESNKILNKKLSKLLKRLDYTVYQAYSLSQANEALDKNDINYIILNLELDDASSVAILVKLQITIDTKIIILDNDKDYQQRDHLFENGIIDYFSRDMMPEYIIRDVHSLISSMKQNDQYNVLVVDDSLYVRKILSNALTQRNYNVLQANDPIDAIKIIDKEEINLLLLDLEMPRMSGVEFLEILKADEKYYDLPVIILSTINERSTYARVLKHGASDFIRKPFIIEEVMLKCDLHIRHSKIIGLESTNIILEKKVSQEHSTTLEYQEKMQEEQLKNAKYTAIGQLTAGITHEINTPLTFIKGCFEMLQYDIQELEESNIKTRMMTDSNKITEGINRIANIVESMREMSQKTKEIKETTNIYASLVTSLTIAHNRSRQISNIYLNGELFDINMDKYKYSFLAKVQKQRLEQVWIILINNALDELISKENFEDRIINVTIKKATNGIIIKFMDNAGGIADEVLDKIFDPFVSTKESGGMGVGLNIAKKIVEDQDATIIAYNENGGAVFEITIKHL